jgi:hypothetical protein
MKNRIALGAFFGAVFGVSVGSAEAAVVLDAGTVFDGQSLSGQFSAGVPQPPLYFDFIVGSLEEVSLFLTVKDKSNGGNGAIDGTFAFYQCTANCNVGGAPTGTLILGTSQPLGPVSGSGNSSVQTVNLDAILAPGNYFAEFIKTGGPVPTTDKFGGEFNVSPVPEPATWALMGIGFACLGFLAYRRKGGQVAFRIV